MASPYVGALRYCVVAIVERLGSILDDGGDFERTSSPAEMTSIVVRLHQGTKPWTTLVFFPSGKLEERTCRS